MKYKYCFQLSNYLNFNHYDIANCTVGNSTKNMRTAKIKEMYKGEPVNWEEIFQNMEDVRNNCKKGIYPEVCDGCQYFVEDDWDNILPDTRELKYCQFSTWVRCNSDCIFCDNHVAPDQKPKTDLYNSFPVLKSLVDGGYITQNTEIDFAGGEPTIYYKFGDMLNLLIKKGVKNISIHTNAINHHRVVEKGIKKGVVSIVVSIDAGSKEVHRKVKRVDSYDKVWKNVVRYNKANNPKFPNYVALKYIIIPGLNDSEEEINLFIQKSVKAKVDYLILNADNNIYKNEAAPEVLDKLIRLSEFFINKCKEYNIKSELAYNISAAYLMRNKA